MTGRITPAPCPFAPQEREYIRGLDLTPSSHSLTCTIAFAPAADGARFFVGRGSFGRRVIQRDYCHTSLPVLSTPEILMLSSQYLPGT